MDEARKLDTNETPEGARPVQRHTRFRSHALVDVRTSRWNPFAQASAVLLDMSEQGFKVEFVSPVRLKPGARLQLTVPLSPFTILSPAKMRFEVELKWFDAGTLRAGGVFLSLDEAQRHVVEKIITRLAEMQRARTAGPTFVGGTERG